MCIILKAENISKQYRLGLVGSGTLTQDFTRWWHRVQGKEDPFLKVGAVNDRSAKATEDYVWALRDINFEVKQGEVLGIIGKNGAGKSTLLKILSKVTGPTTGVIKTKGRIASLLEVGTGFHPELTGKENIFLNGAILGMTNLEVKSKLEEIIDFSGCEMYINTPVKRYSSGMTVRLAFAVAAHLEPEILVVDEVLAVGDAEFQKKAIGKMQDISTGEGRTVLFVSHNMAAVKSLCSRGLVLKNGRSFYEGNIEASIQNYLKDSESFNTGDFEGRKGNGKVQVKDIEIFGQQPGMSPQTGSCLNLKFKVINTHNYRPSDIRFDLRVDDQYGQRIIWLSNSVLSPADKNISPEEIKFFIPKLGLNQGLYYATIYIEVNNEISDWIQNAFSFEVAEGDYYGTGKKIKIGQSSISTEFDIVYK